MARMALLCLPTDSYNDTALDLRAKFMASLQLRRRHKALSANSCGIPLSTVPGNIGFTIKLSCSIQEVYKLMSDRPKSKQLYRFIVLVQRCSQTGRRIPPETRQQQHHITLPLPIRVRTRSGYSYICFRNRSHAGFTYLFFRKPVVCPLCARLLLKVSAACLLGSCQAVTLYTSKCLLSR